MNETRLSELKELYLQTSKHSNYQKLAPGLAELISDDELNIHSRHEAARWAYMSHWISFDNKTIVDVGGNTGFFSFSALEAGAASVRYFEGNQSHAKFVSLASQLSKYNGRIDVNNYYIDLENEELKKPVDIILLLNVLHHIGDDYGDRDSNAQLALQHITNVLSRLAKQTSILIFQLGFNWKGDVDQPLFKHGTKAEMIQFIKASAMDQWDILSIGVAVKNNRVIYTELDESNINRVDELGEFLNRPIFILKRK